MKSKLAGKIAIVTGASKGIGAGIAKELAAQGASVVVNYASSKDGADKVVASITNAGGKATAIKANVASREEVIKLFEAANKIYGGLDILVNNAGIYSFVPIEDISVEKFYETYNINVLGGIYSIQEAIKLFGDKGGNIINIGSSVVTMNIPQSFIYTSSKYVTDAMTRIFSKELAPKKIRVNSINPGSTETEGTLAAGLVGGEGEKFFIANTPMRRIGKVDDITKAVAFLASDDAAYITGEILAVAGGMR